MDAREFTSRLNCLSGDDIMLVAARLGAEAATAAAEVEWWESTLEIQRCLRLRNERRSAARVAHHATACVQASARRAGIDLPDDRVTRVARAAAEVARGLAAGMTAARATRRLMEPWAGVAGPAVSAGAVDVRA